MRGERSIYQSLFDDAPVAQLPAPERKGRSEVLKLKQNELIICRYFYHVKINGVKYPQALAILQDEVYLAPRTIIEIISKENAHLKMLQQAKPDVKYFQKKFPHFNWQYQYQ